MKEVYRSFEGKLDMDHQSGYIINDAGAFWEIEFLSVWSEQEDGKVRIKKEMLTESDFADSDKITELKIAIEDGSADEGQAYYKDKWYDCSTIRSIQRDRQDYYWKRFV